MARDVRGPDSSLGPDEVSIYSEMLRLALQAGGDAPATSVADLVADALGVPSSPAGRGRPGRRLAARERRTCR